MVMHIYNEFLSFLEPDSEQMFCDHSHLLLYNISCLPILKLFGEYDSPLCLKQSTISS